jgi:hypothetical protein
MGAGTAVSPPMLTHANQRLPLRDVLAQHVEELAEVLVRQGFSSRFERSGQRRGQQLTEEGSPQPCELPAEGSPQPSPSRLGFQTDGGC